MKKKEFDPGFSTSFRCVSSVHKHFANDINSNKDTMFEFDNHATVNLNRICEVLSRQTHCLTMWRERKKNNKRNEYAQIVT